MPGKATGNMKILLVQPCHPFEVGVAPSRWPMGLLYLAAGLLDKAFISRHLSTGHGISESNGRTPAANPDVEVVILDLQAESFKLGFTAVEQVHAFFRGKVNEVNPDLVGITSTTIHIFQARHLSVIAKECDPKTKTILGGVHGSALPVETFEEICLRDGRVIKTGFDAVIVGEGVLSFMDVVLALSSGEIDFERVPSMYYQKDENTCKTAFRTRGEDRLHFNEYPMVSKYLHLIDKDTYRLPHDNFRGENIGIILGALGCPYSCGYCASGNEHMVANSHPMFFYEKRDAQNIFNELTNLVETEKLSLVLFIEDTFTADPKRVEQLCDLVIAKKKENRNDPVCKRWKKLRVISNARPETIKQEQFALKLREAGFICSFSMGVESPNARILDLYERERSLKYILHASSLLRKMDIDVQWYIMLGPEDWEEMLHTAQYIMQFCPDYLAVSYLTPYPGTKMADKHLVQFVGDPMDYENNYVHEPTAERKGETFTSPVYSSYVSAKDLSRIRDVLQKLHKHRTVPIRAKTSIVWLLKSVAINLMRGLCEDEDCVPTNLPDAVNIDALLATDNIPDLYAGLHMFFDLLLANEEIRGKLSPVKHGEFTRTLRGRAAEREGETGLPSLLRIIDLFRKVGDDPRVVSLSHT